MRVLKTIVLIIDSLLKTDFEFYGKRMQFLIIESFIYGRKCPRFKKFIFIDFYQVCHLDEMRSYTSKLPAVNQVEYHPHFRRPEIKEYCRKHSIFFQV